MDWFGSKRRQASDRRSQGGGNTHTSERHDYVKHHNHNTSTQKVRIVEKKVYVHDRNRGGLPIGKAVNATVSTGARLGGGLFGLAKKGYEISQKSQHDPMSRDSPYGAKARYKDRKDNMVKVQLGFPNPEVSKRMKKTGFSFILLFLAIAFMAAPMGHALTDTERLCGTCNYVARENNTHLYKETHHNDTDFEGNMLGCFASFICSIAWAPLALHFMSFLWIIVGVITILIMLAFAAILSGAVSRSIDR